MRFLFITSWRICTVVVKWECLQVEDVVYSVYEWCLGTRGICRFLEITLGPTRMFPDPEMLPSHVGSHCFRLPSPRSPSHLTWSEHFLAFLQDPTEFIPASKYLLTPFHSSTPTATAAVQAPLALTGSDATVSLSGLSSYCWSLSKPSSVPQVFLILSFPCLEWCYSCVPSGQLGYLVSVLLTGSCSANMSCAFFLMSFCLNQFPWLEARTVSVLYTASSCSAQMSPVRFC